jgi:glycosyltransferase involved in cell wall biosynthesis
MFSSAHLRCVAVKPYSRFFINSDNANWSLDEDAKVLLSIMAQIGIRGQRIYRPLSNLKQCVHFSNQHAVNDLKVLNAKYRMSFDYFHGDPQSDENFKRTYLAIQRNHRRFSKVRVSCRAMQKQVLSTGIDPAKVALIPIGIRPEIFQFQTAALRRDARRKLGIPETAILIGSFQKDGSGWAEGNEPKWVKGPDVFLKAIEILRSRIPELQVLLTGPSRGYVKAGLERLKVPYHHWFASRYEDVPMYFQALDAYIVASRQEGGPKAVFEAMASGIPLVTTRVGQAADWVDHGKNAYMVDVEDAEALAHFTELYLSNSEKRSQMLRAGLGCAMQHSNAEQLELWRSFFQDYIESSM